MLAFLSAPQNLPFTVSLAVMMIIAVIEGVGTLMGLGLSGFVDNLLPDIDLDLDMDLDLDADMDMDLDVDGIDGAGVGSHGSFTKLLAWLKVGQVPVIILLIVMLVVFGLSGLFIQNIAYNFFGSLLPSMLAVLPALIISFPATRWIGSGLSKIIPKDETSAVSHDTFVGRIAVIVLGTAKHGQAAQAKVKDSFGKEHYIMAEADVPGQVFEIGDEILLVRRVSGTFLGIENTSASLKGS